MDMAGPDCTSSGRRLSSLGCSMDLLKARAWMHCRKKLCLARTVYGGSGCVGLSRRLSKLSGRGKCREGAEEPVLGIGTGSVPRSCDLECDLI